MWYEDVVADNVDFVEIFWAAVRIDCAEYLREYTKGDWFCQRGPKHQEN